MRADPKFTADKNELSAEELADRFAAQALKSALKPAPDGLNVLQELAQRPSQGTLRKEKRD